VLNRLGSLNTYVDGEKVTYLTDGVLSENIWFGTAALQNQQELKTFSDNYTGLLDEFTFWNTTRPKSSFYVTNIQKLIENNLGLVQHV
jgi:hypothetical protein